MKLKLFHKILIGGSLGAIAIGGINHQINTMPCQLLSPGAKQVCELSKVPDTAAAAKSGFILAGTLTAVGFGLGALTKSSGGSVISDRPPYSIPINSATNVGELYAASLMERLAQPIPQPNGFQWNWLIYSSVGITLAIAALASPSTREAITSNPIVQPVAQAVSTVTYKTPPAIASVSKDMNSIAVYAIGHAEGNMTVSGEYTKLIFGHVDPSLIGGRRVINRGWCSNYGKGGNLPQANQGCLERTQSRIPLISSRMEKYGLPPEQNFELFLNILDLWNQASPRVSDVAPKVAGDLFKKGLRGDELILETRIESFRDESTGQLSAGGLFNICANPVNQAHDFVKMHPHRSENWRKACISWDQNRRRKAISDVLKNRGYKQ
ncbi:hypothetical protein [Laspinema olomoucense]|uniref:hypothetical protein n=1 Tax=Laspinema olomoucense TaxID=3231600 RepID=UPI0021BAC550|nr:hypothetical protein [Laspinema sp. D3d]MCT7971138.1 hypothetical protein [Laspinema sp. D3d]